MRPVGKASSHGKALRSRNVLLFATGLVIIVVLGYHHVSTVSSQEAVLVMSEDTGEASGILSRHSIREAHHQLGSASAWPPGPSQPHSFLVLSSTGASGDAALRQLLPLLTPYRQYPDAITISQIKQPASEALAEQLSVPLDQLPVVVYLPPAFETGGGFHGAAWHSVKDATGISGFLTWAKSSTRMTLLLLNDWDNNQICFYYLRTEDNVEVEIACPPTQAEVWQEVSLLDKFTARNKTAGPTGAVLARNTALFSGIFSVHPPTGFCNPSVDKVCEMTKLRYPTDPKVLEVREANDKQRTDAIRDQPSRIKHFTKEGFQLRRAPEDLYLALTGYLNASRTNALREVWRDEDVFTNQFDSPSLKVTLPENGPLKPRLFRVAQRLLEKWIGGTVLLQSTAMYGIRIYTRNNTLHLHCDRPDTHLVSAIINVEQSVEEPWPLQIKDHAGTLHSVVMQPGDMVMYEGASCAHGREEPLKGRYFANAFIHFKPK